MKRTMKQVLGIVLSVLLLLSVLPVGVLGAAETDAGKILNDAYALAEGAVLDYEATLTGKITKIDTPYSSQYSNISVIIEVPGHADKPMLCYRLKGDGADTLAVGDTITVTGRINNYYGRIEFAAGCSLDSVVPGDGLPVVAPEDPKQIVDEAYALAGGESLPYSAVLVGKIISVETPYDEIYKNITVTIEVAGREGQPIQCYRMKGAGVEELKIGDTIKVEGQIKRYIKTDAETGEVILDLVEFNVPNFLELISDSGVDPTDPTDPTEPTDPTPTTPLEIVDAAYALQDGESLEGIYTLTGEIIAVDTPWSELFYNITVTIIVEDRPIQCYRLKGDGADLLTVGTTITVTGTLTNYRGTIEFAQGCTLDAVSYGEYVISQGTLEFPAPDIESVEAYIEFVSTDNGTVTLTLSEVEPHFHVVIYEDNLWLTDFQGTVAPAEKEFQVKKDSHYTVILSAVLYQNSNLDAWTQIGGYLTYKFTSDVPVRDLSHWNPADPWSVVDAAYMLGPGEALPYEPTLTGTITEVVTEYSPEHMNITVNMVVAGREDKPLQCYRMRGDGVDTLKVGDTITVTGTLKNYTKTNAETGETITTIEFYPCTLLEVISVDDWGPESLALVGSGIPGLVDWNPADPEGDMTEVSDHVYEIVVECPAGTSMQFRFAGNDTWDDQWNFGSDYFVPNRLCQLTCGGGSSNMYLTVEKNCTLIFTVDLNGMRYGGNATLLVEEIVGPEPTRKLTVIAPFTWNSVWAYTWDPESFNLWPGTELPMFGGVSQTEVSGSMENLVLSGILADGNREHTGDIYLEDNGLDVVITVAVDCTYQINYVEKNKDTFRVAGNAYWMGDWDPASNIGVMTEVSAGVYRKCFENVAPGSYEFLITKNGSWDERWGDGEGNYCFTVTKTCDVTVTFTYLDGEGIIDVDYIGGIMGDVSGDGRLNMGDVAKLYAHIRNTNPLTDEAALIVADFTGDGKINIGDTARIYAYIRGTDPAAIVDGAYQLGQGEEMSKDSTLTGTVLDIIEPYDDRYGCITVIMAISGREDYPIVCSRLMGENARNVGVNDKITVTGILRNFYGSIEFKEGCQLVKWEDVPNYEEYLAQIVDEAYALGDGETMDRDETLMGKVISIDQAYIAGLPYISLTMAVEGREDKPISCYRLVGDGIEWVRIGDTVTVTGTLRNFYGVVEFAAGCVLEDWVSDYPEIEVETDPLKIVDLAYELWEGEEIPYNVTLTGKVIEISDAFNSQYQNISVVIEVPGREGFPILCYRLRGEGVASIASYDTITVEGRLRNYFGEIEVYNCIMTNRVSGGGQPIVPETDAAKILAAGQLLDDYEELPYSVTLGGKVVSIDDAYNADFCDISVTIAVDGTDQTLVVYRLKGDGVEMIAVNDIITVEGRIKKYYGQLELVNGNMTSRISGGGNAPVVQTDYKKIVDEAYALAEGAQLPYDVTLEGKIVELITPYDALYMNMTVAIEVPGREGMPIECYRMKGADIGNHLCVGDTITVTGRIKNYRGTIEFDAGCQMTEWTAGNTSKPTDPQQIVDAAFALGKNEVLPYFATLTGMVKSIDTAYDDLYKNVTLTMTVQGTDVPRDIVCYRLRGEQAANVAVGSTITVTGAIKNYVGIDKETGAEKPPMVEFDAGCLLESLQP